MSFKDPKLRKMLAYARNKYTIHHDKIVQNAVSRNSKRYKWWRREVFKNGGYKCFMCESESNLHAHHIEEWGKNKRLRLVVSNGVVVCKGCHMKLHPYMSKYEKGCNENKT